MGRTVTLLLVAALGAACGRSELPVQPTQPPVRQVFTPPPAPVTPPLTVSAVAPNASWPFYYTEVLGSGFKPGVRVTFGGVEARAYYRGDGKFATDPPWREPGTVDVVVTNPDGSSVTLAEGFTYRAATLELSQSVVSPGESLIVAWSGPHAPSDFLPPDTIGVYAVDDPLNAPLWYADSAIGDRFSVRFNAPTKPGSYEVRYLMLRKYLLAKVPLAVR